MDEQGNKAAVVAAPERRAVKQRIELFHRRKRRIANDLPGAFAAFLRAHFADGLQHGQLAVKVMVESALGKMDLVEDILHRGLLISL